MFGYIYKTTNLLNNKIYIGQHKSSNFDTKYFGSGKLIVRAIEKYGKENFKCELLKECCSQQELDEQEKLHINKFNSKDVNVGYNIADGGAEWAYHLGMLGKKQSEKQRRAASIACSYKRSDEVRQHMSESAKNRKPSSIPYKDKIWVSDGLKEIRIDPENVEEFIDKGFIPNTRLNRSEECIQKIKNKYSNGCYVNKDGKDIFIEKSQLENYLNDGYCVGRKNCYTEQRNKNISNSKKGCVCINNGTKNFYVKPEKVQEFLDKGFTKGKI